MKKKIISVILILVMLLLPFGGLLNVKAETLNVDNNTTNGQGKKVLNTTSVTVNEIGVNNTLGMYKLLDVYYDSTSNQMSYGFTSSFGTFANAQNPALTVNDYLTTDDTYNGNNPYYDNSDFNELVSDYAKYVRANNVSVTYTMTTSYNSQASMYSATYANAEAGVYLILPTSIIAQNYTADGFERNTIFEYGVMIANAVPTAGTNNTWDLDPVSFSAKKAGSGLYSYLVEATAANFLSAFSGNATFGTILNYKAGQSYSYFFSLDYSNIPAYAHSSIQSLISNRTLGMIDIAYPSSITPDFTSIYCFVSNSLIDAKVENNKYYGYDSENDRYVELADVITSGNTVTFDFPIAGDAVFNLTIDPSSLSNAAAGNTITATTYVVKDPYVDIGTNITTSDIRAAFDSNDANYSSNKSVAIRKAIEKVEKSVTLYVTGLTVNNTNSSSNALSGGEFAVYGSYDSSTGVYSNQLGSNIVMDSNGTGLLNGLDPTHTYYLKQVKAPSGYRLYDEKIIVLPGTGDSTQYDSSTYQVVSVSNGMYTANVVNQPVLALPFTGGSGTAAYTLIGLLIVAGAGIFLVLYKKKNKKEVLEEL